MIGGLQLAVNASSAGLLRGENLVWTTSFRSSTAGPTGGGWSTRLGYEPYFPNITSGYAPFAALGPIDSIYVGSSNGAIYRCDGQRCDVLFKMDSGVHAMLYDHDADNLLVLSKVMMMAQVQPA
jgi:hypothetical protein